MQSSAFQRQELRLRPLTFRKRQTGIASLKHSEGLVRPAAFVGVKWTFVEDSGRAGFTRSGRRDGSRIFGAAHADDPHGTLGEPDPRDRQSQEFSSPTLGVGGDPPLVPITTSSSTASGFSMISGVSSSTTVLPPVRGATEAPADLRDFSFAKLRRAREHAVDEEMSQAQGTVRAGVEKLVDDSLNSSYQRVDRLRQEKARSRRSSLRSLLSRKATSVGRRRLHSSAFRTTSVPSVADSDSGSNSGSVAAESTATVTDPAGSASIAVIGGPVTDDDGSATSPTSTRRMTATTSSPVIRASQVEARKAPRQIVSDGTSPIHEYIKEQEQQEQQEQQQQQQQQQQPQLSKLGEGAPRSAAAAKRPPEAIPTASRGSAPTVSTDQIAAPFTSTQSTDSIATVDGSASMSTPSADQGQGDGGSGGVRPAVGKVQRERRVRRSSSGAQPGRDAAGAVRHQSGLTPAEREAERVKRKLRAERKERERQAAIAAAEEAADEEKSRLELEIKAVEAEAAQLESEVTYTEEEIAYANEVKMTRLEREKKAQKSAVEETLLIWKPTQMVRDLAGAPIEEISALTGQSKTAIEEAQRSQMEVTSRAADTALRKAEKGPRMTKLEKMHAAIARSNSTIGQKQREVRPRPEYGSWYVPPKDWGQGTRDDEELKPAHIKAREALDEPAIETHPLSATAMRLKSTQLYAEFLHRNELYVPAYLKTVPVRDELITRSARPSSNAHVNVGMSPAAPTLNLNDEGPSLGPGSGPDPSPIEPAIKLSMDDL